MRVGLPRNELVRHTAGFAIISIVIVYIHWMLSSRCCSFYVPREEEEIKIFAIKYFRPLVIYEFLWHTILA